MGLDRADRRHVGRMSTLHATPARDAVVLVELHDAADLSAPGFNFVMRPVDAVEFARSLPAMPWLCWHGGKGETGEAREDAKATLEVCVGILAAVVEGPPGSALATARRVAMVRAELARLLGGLS